MLIKFTGPHLIDLYRLTSELSLLSPPRTVCSGVLIDGLPILQGDQLPALSRESLPLILSTFEIILTACCQEVNCSKVNVLLAYLIVVTA